MRRGAAWRVVAAVSVAAALVAGCSDDDDPNVASSTTTTTASGPGVTDGGNPGEGPTDDPTVDVQPLPAVSVGEPSDFGDGLIATVTRVENADLEATGPGEIAGPGVIVHLEIRNDTSGPVDLGLLAVNASYGGTPAVPRLFVSVDPLAGPLGPGERRSGTYAFQVPADQRSSVVIDVHHAEELRFVLVEVGDAAT